MSWQRPTRIVAWSIGCAVQVLVTQVRGFADQRGRKKDDPLDSGNRRISLVAQYLSRPETPENDSGKIAEQTGENGHDKKLASSLLPRIR
jgi:hypothetical protein